MLKPALFVLIGLIIRRTQGSTINLFPTAAKVPFSHDETKGELLICGLENVTNVKLAVFGTSVPRLNLVLGPTTFAVSSTTCANEATVLVDLTKLPMGLSRVQVRALGPAGLLALADCLVTRAPRKGGLAQVTVHRHRGIIAGNQNAGSPLPLVPFGAYIYNVDDPANRNFPRDESPQGLNLVAPYISKASNHTEEEWGQILSFLDNCSAVGMRVHYHLNSLAALPDAPAKYSILREEVLRVRDHPALLAYYIADEPGGAHMAPEKLEKVYAFVRNLDPHHPMTMAFCCCDPLEYRNAFDIGMMDPYPIVSAVNDSVNHQRLVSMVTGAANKLAATNKPFFIVLQSFGGGEAWQRSPTAAEERLMAYLALVHGAVGLQYFVRAPDCVFPQSPSAWQEVRRVALEVAELTPAITSGTRQTNTRAATAAGARVGGIRVSGNRTRVDAAVWQASSEPGHQYAVAAVANTENEPTQLVVSGLSLPPGASASPGTSALAAESLSLFTGAAEVINQHRNVSVINGTLSDMLSAYGTAAYRFPANGGNGSWGGGGLPSAHNQILNPSYEYAASVGTPDGDYLSYGGGGSADHAGASFMSDARTSVDGLHSLRLTAPSAGASIAGGPFFVGPPIRNGTNYSISVVAKAATEGIVLDLRPAPGFKIWPTRPTTGSRLRPAPELGPLPPVPLPDGHCNASTGLCLLSTGWRRYELIGLATSESRATTNYRLHTPGIAWLDRLDVHQLNDCPSGGTGAASSSFFDMALPPYDWPQAQPLNGNTSRCCKAGWLLGVDFKAICEAHQDAGWVWWYPDGGPYTCCKKK
jgi:hypothetical protein